MNSPVDACLLAELLEKHCAALELYASQWTFAADDCVQEAFIELARQPEAPNNLVAWLYRVVRNRALNAARSTNRRKRYEKQAAQAFTERLKSRLDKTDAFLVVSALESLPSELRELVVLRIWSELTWEEIAELSGLSSSSAQRRYVAALERMRVNLEPSCLPK